MITASGEVAQFVDDNQFGSGQSQDKCGPEAISVFWHSTKPGTHNPYTAQDVHNMAHDDYIKFIGPDVTSDQGGTSNELLYNMLRAHGFAFVEGPLSISWIKGWLENAYPVIIGLTESSVHDIGINGSPYNWDTTGRTHIIVVSGPGNGDELLVRDTANIDTNGVVRTGPRHYTASKLQLTSATMVVPSWLPATSSANPPTPTPAPPPVDYKKLVQSLTAQLAEAVKHL